LRRVVLDSSVAVKWLPILRHEPLAAEARELRRNWEDGKIAITVPDFFWVEIAAVLWKTQRRMICTAAEAETALDDLLALQIPTRESRPLLESTLRISTRYDRAVYDGLYLALAQDLGAEFVTADEKVANAVAAYLPVKWLGALQMR
jgi:predicted nucleic acid-binding protein